MLDGFGDGGQRAVAVPGLALLDGQVVQRAGEVGQVGGGAGLGQGAADLDGFGDRGQRAVAVPGLALPSAYPVEELRQNSRLGHGGCTQLLEAAGVDG